MKNILISEKQLEELVKTIKENSNEELEEGFLGDLGRDIGTLRFGNIFAGLKGVFSGKGYNLNRNMNIIKNSLRKLKNSEKLMLSVMKDLKHVEVEFSELETTNEIVGSIISNLRSVVSNYEGYKYASRNLQNIVKNYYEEEKKGKETKSTTLVNPLPNKTSTSTNFSGPIVPPSKPKTDSEPIVTTTTTKSESITDKEKFFKDWISGEYKLDGDNMIYYLTIRKTWEVRKQGGTFEPLRTVLKRDSYEKKLVELQNAKKV